MKYCFNIHKIKVYLSLLLVSFFLGQLKAHDTGHTNVSPLTRWEVSGSIIEASFLKNNNKEIYLELSDGRITKFNLDQFSKVDQQKLQATIQHIDNINAQHQNQSISQFSGIAFASIFIIVLILLTIILVKKWGQRKLAFAIGGFICFFAFKGFKINVLGPLTDPLFIDAAFAPHKHRLKTRWDNTWFYVENNGLPEHVMMKGIVKWQQQVPLPQCYTGANSWQIPLNPEIAANPIPVNQMHFLRGAVAIAANGIAIFNPFTTSGQDAYTDGQLDIYGGHSGRADDYHYHTAPFHLQDDTKNLPIAFALDGYAVYGTKEPDGSPMKPLDSFHGHFGDNGVYHYHGTKEAPYMIGIMKGKVTEDATMQLIPQPRANGVRPALTPLSGAVITDFKENGQGNGFILTYTRNNLEYKVDYSWTTTGKYTYNFISPSGTVTENYNGDAPCGLISATEELEMYATSFAVYPVPTTHTLTIDIHPPFNEQDIKELALYDLMGRRMYHTHQAVSTIDVLGYAKGWYNLQIKTKNNIIISKKVLIQ